MIGFIDSQQQAEDIRLEESSDVNREMEAIKVFVSDLP